MKPLVLSMALGLAVLVPVGGAQADPYFRSPYRSGYTPGYNHRDDGHRHHDHGPGHDHHSSRRPHFDYVPGHYDWVNGRLRYVPPHTDYHYRGQRYPVVTDAWGRPQILPWNHRD